MLTEGAVERSLMRTVGAGVCFAWACVDQRWRHQSRHARGLDDEGVLLTEGRVRRTEVHEGEDGRATMGPILMQFVLHAGDGARFASCHAVRDGEDEHVPLSEERVPWFLSRAEVHLGDLGHVLTNLDRLWDLAAR